MAGRSFLDLAHHFIRDVELAGATVLVQGDFDRRPLRCRILASNFNADVEVYLWTVTPGGKGRGRPDERRVQLTGVQQFSLKAGVRTIIGGYSEECGVYAFWDVRRHLAFTPGSSSLQINKLTLDRGYHVGMAAETRSVREGPEVAVAVQPDFLLWYIQEYERLYECAGEIDAAAQLVDQSPEDERAFIDEGATDTVRSSRHKVVAIVHNFRDARFRPTVLRAYAFRCCISGMALRLVDAAHIIPVHDPRSTDDVRNGLALNALYHRAYDTGILGILPGGGIAFNTRLVDQLRGQNLGDGFQQLRAQTAARIRMPPSADLRPSDDALRRGLLLRGWTPDEIAHPN